MRHGLAIVAVIAAAAYTLPTALQESSRGAAAFDVYNYFYPNMLHALRSLADGGRGLLWNPFQNCGQPFFAITESGLLYPFNVAFLIAPPHLALRMVLFANLIVGGVGSYALGREIGLSTVAAIGAALAFLLGNAAFQLTVWMPTVQAPYMWMPAAMFCCERLVRAPGIRPVLGLGLVLALSLLPGHPQFVLFTAQLVALRVLWAVTERNERAHLARAAVGASAAFALMLLLTAAQFVSSLQLIAESVRHTGLSRKEIMPGGEETLAMIGASIRAHSSIAPLSPIAALLAVIAVVGTARRRAALFYFLAAALFLILSFGYATSLGRFYYSLPIAPLFRWPMRFRYITAFCSSVLVGIAIDALAEGRWRVPAVAAAMSALLWAWLGDLLPIDLALGAGVLAGALLAAASPRARVLGSATAVAAIALTAILAAPWGIQRHLADDRPLYAYAALFDRLRERLTPQDRVHLALPRQRDPSFEEKTALLFGLPSTTDYETQMLQRYAEYVTMLRSGQVLAEINQVYFPGLWSPPAVRWRLFDLAAARYLIVPVELDSAPLRSSGGATLRRIDEDGALRVYENANAQPRAYYVPQVAVVSGANERLRRLASGRHDPRRLALLEAAPPSGFMGMPGNDATADARFVVDEPERVVIETLAPERGYLFLADTYFPEWTATVNGQPAPILVGNHAFRLVEVPKGPVTVEFRYRPRLFWIGAAISLATLLAGTVAWIWAGRRRGSQRDEPLAAAVPAGAATP